MSETGNEQPAPAPKKTNQEQTVELLSTFLERAKQGQLANVAVAFTTMQGNADVFSSPMSPVSMCHLLKLFERRVNSSYDRVMRATDAKPAASPTGALRTNGPGVNHVAKLPRKVRRVVQKAQKKVQAQNAKMRARQQSAADVIAAQPTGKPQ